MREHLREEPLFWVAIGLLLVGAGGTAWLSLRVAGRSSVRELLAFQAGTHAQGVFNARETEAVEVRIEVVRFPVIRGQYDIPDTSTGIDWSCELRRDGRVLDRAWERRSVSSLAMGQQRDIALLTFEAEAGATYVIDATVGSVDARVEGGNGWLAVVPLSEQDAGEDDASPGLLIAFSASTFVGFTILLFLIPASLRRRVRPAQ